LLSFFVNFLNAEAAAKTGMILLLGEITSKGVVDYQKIVRDTVRQIGYDDTSKGNFDHQFFGIACTYLFFSFHSVDVLFCVCVVNKAGWP